MNFFCSINLDKRVLLKDSITDFWLLLSLKEREIVEKSGTESRGTVHRYNTSVTFLIPMT